MADVDMVDAPSGSTAPPTVAKSTSVAKKETLADGKKKFEVKKVASPLHANETRD